MFALHKLMSVPQEARDQNWVLEALQQAVELEFSTIPPYLYAMWSIDSHNDPDDVIRALHHVVVEEMLHMGLACNLLTGLGAKPLIASRVPTYPGPLVAGVHADLMVGLEPLSKTLLLTKLMVIEEPETIVVNDPDFQPSHSKLIGNFYNAIQDAITKENLTFDPAKQIDLSNFFSPPVTTPAATASDANAAIDLILKQGEGSNGLPFEADTDAPSHFYLFGALYHGQKISTTAPFAYNGAPIAFPGVHPIPSNPTPQPQHEEFNQAFSAMLRQLESAWASLDASMLQTAAFVSMPALSTLAQQLITQGTGPTFLYIPEASEVPPVVVPPVVVPPVVAPPVPVVPDGPLVASSRFAKVKQILDDAVQGQNIGAHGPFWRGLLREPFVAKKVFGQQLLTVGNAATSNLIKALRGQLPFGSDTGTVGASFQRMPAGRPPVAETNIQFIEQWINDGCPDDAPLPLPMALMSMTTGAAFTPEAHIAFWRDFDDWAMFHASSEVQDSEGAIFGIAGAWFAYAKDDAQKAAWIAAIGDASVSTAATMLSARQQQTIENHYGTPLPLLAALDAFQLFGADQLPNDPLRPQDNRHRMDGAQMWFVWSAFAQACIDLNISTEFWRFVTRAILCGLLNDGVFRGRFGVNGFAATPQGQRDILAFVQNIADNDLTAELRRRYVDSGL